VMGHLRWLLAIRRWSAKVDGGCPAPAPGPHGRTPRVQPLFCRGRPEGTEQFRGRRDGQERCSAITITMVL